MVRTGRSYSIHVEIVGACSQAKPRSRNQPINSVIGSH